MQSCGAFSHDDDVSFSRGGSQTIGPLSNIRAGFPTFHCRDSNLLTKTCFQTDKFWEKNFRSMSRLATSQKKTKKLFWELKNSGEMITQKFADWYQQNCWKEQKTVMETFFFIHFLFCGSKDKIMQFFATPNMMSHTVKSWQKNLQQKLRKLRKWFIHVGSTNGFWYHQLQFLTAIRHQQVYFPSKNT